MKRKKEKKREEGRREGRKREYQFVRLHTRTEARIRLEKKNSKQHQLWQVSEGRNRCTRESTQD